MQMAVGDYLDTSDSLNDMALKAGGPEAQSLYTALSQATAIAAVAAAIERLAQAVENLSGPPGAQGRS
jgi:hypothetical protein